MTLQLEPFLSTKLFVHEHRYPVRRRLPQWKFLSRFDVHEHTFGRQSATRRMIGPKNWDAHGSPLHRKTLNGKIVEASLIARKLCCCLQIVGEIWITDRARRLCQLAAANTLHLYAIME
jgi:hypothetical protein